jgi:phenylpropionate dioxygenase-like ring-hydroxylating dioxygenase large terminal subunit
LSTAIVDDPDLAASLDAGRTLPAEWYTDGAFLRREEERIFRRVWLYAGPASAVERPGSYAAYELGNLFPVVAVRDEDGALRAFANVCRHRGHLVAQGTGACASLQCPYHAWTYALDGHLRAAPRSAWEPDFDPAAFSLVPLEVATWGPLLFICADPEAGPLATALGDLPDIVARSGVDLAALTHHARGELSISANWKLVVENYLECYHCPVAHKSFAALVDTSPDAYVLEPHRTFLSQFGKVNDAARDAAKDLAYNPIGEVTENQYHLLWPNLAVMTYAGRSNLIVYAYEPAGPDATRRISDHYFAPDVDETTRREIIAFGLQLFHEDRALVESVQKGLRSGFVRQGRVLPRSELLVHHFQKMIHRALVDRETSSR